MKTQAQTQIRHIRKVHSERKRKVSWWCNTRTGTPDFIGNEISKGRAVIRGVTQPQRKIAPDSNQSSLIITNVGRSNFITRK